MHTNNWRHRDYLIRYQHDEAAVHSKAIERMFVREGRAAAPLTRIGHASRSRAAFALSLRFGAQLIGRLACVLTGLDVPLLFRHPATQARQSALLLRAIPQLRALHAQG